jgi:RHH-type proline utilization regulon transcriptional repressor/proline dehydrogenase/delta 1-pyrroline-5-carboxylate dehydrogenase
MDPTADDIETATRRIGARLFERTMAHDRPGVTERAWWERKALAWLTADPDAKSRILRFIDVYPSLVGPKEIARHLREYLPHASHRLPVAVAAGLKLAHTPLMTPRAVAVAVDVAMRKVAAAFVAGETMEATASILDRLLADGVGYTIDLLGEATLSDREADAYLDRYVTLLEYLTSTRAPGDPVPEVSVKLTALTPHFKPCAPEAASAAARERLRRIVRVARQSGAGVTVDMESFVYRDLTVDTFFDLLEEEEFAAYDGAGIVAQAYLTDAEEKLAALLARIARRGRPVTVRLVKGAYWDQEIVAADREGYPIPVRIDKADTDAAYERMTETLLAADAPVRIAFASHNIRSVARAVALARRHGKGKGAFEIQLLYGMAEPFRRALVAEGIPVRVYAPVGKMVPGMAYLVRRILENAANESFLRHITLEGQTADEALAPPVPADAPPPPGALEAVARRRTFVNEPAPALHDPSRREAMDRALTKVEGLLGRRVPVVIGGKEIVPRDGFVSADPARPSRIVGEVAAANAQLAAAAIENGARAFVDWRRRPVEERLSALSRAAEIMRGRRYELAAWQVYEVGKTRFEALADVAEAIDHIEYAAREAWRLARPQETAPVLGETNVVSWRPRGVGALVAPWNFPLAILAGMTGAALAAGNCVVIKPSSDAPVIGSIFYDILRTAGIPEGVVNFLPGAGSTVGDVILDHSQTDFVMFTGSYATGARLVERAARRHPIRTGFVKMVAEMGGKNAVVIDASADLDAAVAGVMGSAFGYGGQKCSAASRIVLHAAVYNAFAERLVEGVKSLKVGDPTDPATDYGPLINAAARDKAESYIRLGEKELTPLTPTRPMEEEGYYVRPVLFGDVPPTSPVAREEIFGPVVCLMRAGSLDEAIDMANDADYALTAGVYSRTPSSITLAKERLEAGNVYVNRGITGAVVTRQPFGGYKRSGLGGAKAGSTELLKELSIPRVESENILRHGFSPDIGG